MLVKGSIVALVTPLNEDGSINLEHFDELIEFHVANKTDALLILGTTGESATFTHEEDDSIVRYVIDKVNHRIPVYVGAGSNCTSTMVKYCQKYESMGADALLVIAPYYNKANEEGMYMHFKTVADAVHTPLILYNVPGRTGCSIPVSVVEKLSKHPNVQAIKEASGNISYTMKVAQYVNDDFQLYSGNDDMIVPVLSLGGSGVISVAANILPLEMHELVMNYIEGKREESLAIQLKYLEVINNLFIEVNPIPVKEAMNMLGFEVGKYRLPLAPLKDANREILRASLHKVIDFED